MLLLHNSGKGFTDVSAESGGAFQQRWVGRGLAVGDINNDGRVDAVVTTNDGAAHVLYNQTATSNHWLSLTLVGHTSNRDGIGAEVKLTTPEGTQLVTVSTCGSYLSSSDKRAHFGLGTELVAQRVEIRWPNATVQRLKDVKADQVLRVDEPDGDLPLPVLHKFQASNR